MYNFLWQIYFLKNNFVYKYIFTYCKYASLYELIGYRKRSIQRELFLDVTVVIARAYRLTVTHL